jgi:hypothetical protein
MSWKALINVVVVVVVVVRHSALRVKQIVEAVIVV